MKATFLEYGAASGSIGGKVYSRNQYGPYIRSRVVPVNPNTARQQAARNRFQEMASRWSAVLTDVQQIAWNLYGSSVSMLDALGQTMYLSGYSHYIRSNSAILQGPLGVVDAGPTDFTLPDVDSSMTAAISEATQVIIVTFDDTKVWCSEDEAFMSIHMTSPQNPSRYYLDIKLRWADHILGDSITPITSPQNIACPYAVVEGQKVIVKARIGRADGRLSQFFQDTVVIAA